MSGLFLGIVKGIVLLIGIALLVGGGLCFAVAPFLGSSPDSAFLIPVAVIAAIVVGWLIMMTLKQPFAQQAKYLALLIGGLFLVGGGLCSGGTSSQTMSGLLFMDIAVALMGYLLVRWMLSKKKN